MEKFIDKVVYIIFAFLTFATAIAIVWFLFNADFARALGSSFAFLFSCWLANMAIKPTGNNHEQR